MPSGEREQPDNRDREVSELCARMGLPADELQAAYDTELFLATQASYGCLTPDEILDWTFRRLDPAREEHARTCRLCCGLLRRAEPSRELRARFLQVVQERQAEAPKKVFGWLMLGLDQRAFAGLAVAATLVLTAPMYIPVIHSRIGERPQSEVALSPTTGPVAIQVDPKPQRPVSAERQHARPETVATSASRSVALSPAKVRVDFEREGVLAQSEILKVASRVAVERTTFVKISGPSTPSDKSITDAEQHIKKITAETVEVCVSEGRAPDTSLLQQAFARSNLELARFDQASGEAEVKCAAGFTARFNIANTVQLAESLTRLLRHYGGNVERTSNVTAQRHQVLFEDQGVNEHSNTLQNRMLYFGKQPGQMTVAAFR